MSLALLNETKLNTHIKDVLNSFAGKAYFKVHMHAHVVQRKVLRVAGKRS